MLPNNRLDLCADLDMRGLIFPVFAFCVLCLCLAFCVLLGANMAANVGHPQCTVGHPQCTVRHPEVQILGAIVS